jgi:hypothetical protein
MNSAVLCSLAGRYDNPIPTRFLAPIGCLKIPAQDRLKQPETSKKGLFKTELEPFQASVHSELKEITFTFCTTYQDGNLFALFYYILSNVVYYSKHRLNMEIDFQSLFRLQVT